jgi:PhzF family phenazine biosynthesis protein
LWLEAAGRLASAAASRGLRQELAGQVLPVEVARGAGRPALVWMDQSPPHFGDVAGDRARLAACLGLDERDLLEQDAQVVSTGAGHLLVPAGNRGAVDRAAADPARLVPALREVGAEGCYLYSPDPVDAAGAVAYARFFNPAMGITEDPATGTAAGPLAARLVATGRVPDESTVVIEQGYALGRPSRITVSVFGQRVRIGGSGLVVAEGTLAV